HHCLRKWLLQHPNVEESCCKVCKHRYTIKQEPVRFFSLVLKSKRSSLIIPAIVVAVVAPCATVVVFFLVNSLQTYVKVLVLGSTILLELAAFKVVGLNFTKLYQVTRESALRILNYKSPQDIRDDVQCDYDVIDGTVLSQQEVVETNNRTTNNIDACVMVHVT
uniref:RING-CH-type domain-containing protein n=1 Tax=Ciona savignyi TaxID=51511 RepID=H2Z859_CIOSA